MQQDDHEIAWYQSFFKEKKRGSADAALEEAETRRREARDVKDAVAEARAHKELGLIHLTQTHIYDQAMDHFIRCLAIEDSLNLKEQRIFTLLSFARVFETVSDHEKSHEFLETALQASLSFNNHALAVMILNDLGKVNAARGNIEAAFANYEQILNYEEQHPQPAVRAEAIFNIANLHRIQGEYKDALNEHKEALSITRATKDRKSEAYSLNAIGELYRLMKNDERALANHVAALEIRQALKDKRGMAISYNNIGVLLYDQGNFDRAIANLSLGYQTAGEAQDQEQVARSSEYLSFCYEKKGNYPEALRYKQGLVTTNDFIQNDKNEQELLKTHARYDINTRESQIHKLELDRVQRERELEAQKNFRNFLYIVIGLIVVIAVLVLYLYLQKQKSNKALQAVNEKVQHQNIELQDLNATKDKFFSIISHDLKGPLNSLTSFSGLLINHTDSLSKEEIKMLAKDLDKSLKNLFALLENLLEWSRSQTGTIEFKPENFDLTTLLNENKELLTAQAQNKKITIIQENTSKVPVHVHKHSVNTVVRNLISNAIKFTPEGGTITLAIQQSAREVIVSVKDTGVGMGPDVVKKLFRIDTKHSTSGTANEKGTGLGLILCKDFIEKNGGRIWVTSEPDKGSTFSFSLPRS